MLRGKGFLVLAAVTVAVAAAAMYSMDRGGSVVPQAGTPVFEGLLARVNDAARVEVRAGGKTFTLERKGSGWVAPQRDGYPLAGDKLHNLLVGAAGLERLEPKTGNPGRFSELGLRDPGEKDSRAVEFKIRDEAGGSLAELVVGERRPAKGDPNRTEYFVRVPGEERSWLVRGSLPADSDELVDWLDRSVAAVSGSRIARVKVAHPDGELVTATRDAPGGGDFRYAELPAGAELEGAWMINDIGRVLTDLRLDDVKSAAAAPSAPDGIVDAVVETFDGLRVRVRTWREGETTLAALRAEFDESLIAKPAGDKPPEGLLAPDAVRAEAAALDARWQPWVYVLPDYKGDYLRRRQNDLVKKATPEEKPAS